MSSIFAGLDASVDGWLSTMDQFKALADQYGVKLTIYEGGQGMGGASNYELKHLAEFDKRMYDSYERLWRLFHKKFPDMLYMHFSLVGGEGSPDYTWWETPGQPWKTWGWWNAIPYQETDLSVCGQNMISFGEPTATQARSQIDQLHTQISPQCPKYQSISQHTKD
jgi:hypothetical protein